MANPPTACNVKMKRTGRKRRAAGWTLLLLGLLVAGVWVASGWFSLRHVPIGQKSYMDIQMGTVNILSGFFGFGVAEPQFKYDPPPSWRFVMRGDAPPPWIDTLRLGVINRSEISADEVEWDICLWPFPLMLLAAGAAFLRSGILARLRASTGSCRKCGYSLAGLAAGSACPECGKGTAAT